MYEKTFDFTACCRRARRGSAADFLSAGRKSLAGSYARLFGF
jgi:hypothetical protein